MAEKSWDLRSAAADHSIVSEGFQQTVGSQPDSADPISRVYVQVGVAGPSGIWQIHRARPKRTGAPLVS